MAITSESMYQDPGLSAIYSIQFQMLNFIVIMGNEYFARYL